LARFRPNRRLRLGTVLVLLVFATLGGRLVQLQLTDGRAFAAAGLHDRLRTTVLPAARGSILDRDGNVLAESIEARYIYADPSRVVNPTVTATKLRDLLAIPVDQLMPKLTDKLQPNGTKNEFVYLARGLDIPTANAVMALDLPGIGEGLDQRRENPGHDLAANLIGFVGTDQTGLAGLEYADNDLLAGRNGVETYEIGNGNLITKLPGGYDQITPARPGSSLELTIDRDLQYEVQQALYARMTAANADFGAAVVMKVSTGEVLAQASYPSYDAAAYADYPQSSYRDAATETTVDPGSSAKIVTIGAALNTGAIQPDHTVTLPGGRITIGGTTYRDDTPFPKGTRITLPGILAYSSNLGTIDIASHLSSTTIYQYQHLFGLGTPTGEGVQNEASGDLLPPSQWTATSWGSIPIGEGLSATPLQMTAAYCAIANNGTWIQPHIVKATIASNGKVTPAPAPSTHAVLTPAVAAELRTDLEAVTTAQGATATRAAVKGYVIAGKTGTGRQYLNGAYLPGYAISFIGMAPADHPEYVIGVFAHVPDGSGGLYAAPAFRDMMSFTLQHYRVPATGDKVPTFQLTSN
jgi:cell division protein FtsI (penicillin-binding protein 3)